MKQYLLIMGDNHYPSIGTGDWKDCYTTKAEAASKVAVTNKGSYSSYRWDDEQAPAYPVEYDWYKIVDLRAWMEK